MKNSRTTASSKEGSLHTCTPYMTIVMQPRSKSITTPIVQTIAGKAASSNRLSMIFTKHVVTSGNNKCLFASTTLSPAT